MASEARLSTSAGPETPRVRLTRLELEGFRSIAQMDVSLRSINVLIGPNGAGKSNLIAFFRLLASMLSRQDGLARFVAQSGGASVLLHGGPKRTSRIRARLEVETHQGVNDYEFILAYADGDSLYFDLERCRFSRRGGPANPDWIDFGSGHVSPQILDASHNPAQKTHRTILNLLRGLRTYHFHDTSRTAHLRQHSPLDADRSFREDAGNIAPFLLRLAEHRPPYYRRILMAFRQIVPFFDDFVLEPEGASVLLRWRETGSDLVFGAHQASDGMLRALAVLTLLLQPPELLPAIIVIDEPELGLHPFAIRVVAGLFRAATVNRQCLIATQSPELLNEFAADDVVVVERAQHGSRLRRLSAAELERWLDEYSLGEMWDMNMLGGRPKPLLPAEA